MVYSQVYVIFIPITPPLLINNLHIEIETDVSHEYVTADFRFFQDKLDK